MPCLLDPGRRVSRSVPLTARLFPLSTQASFRLTEDGALKMLSASSGREFSINPQGLKQVGNGGQEIAFKVGPHFTPVHLATAESRCGKAGLHTYRLSSAYDSCECPVQCSAEEMMEFNVIGQGASSVVRPSTSPG